MISNEELSRIAKAFPIVHGEMNQGMLVRIKPGLAPLVVVDEGTDYSGVFAFVQWVNAIASGQDDNPLNYKNYVIGDCLVIANTAVGCCPILMDSRFIEPVIAMDDSQLQLAL
jgi:hypothetical protein